MAYCRKCGAAEDLGQPFIDGACVDCLRKEEEAKRPPPKIVQREIVTEPEPPKPEPKWTGLQFIVRSGLISIVSGIFGFIAAQCLGDPSAQPDGATGIGIICALISSICGAWSAILLIVGIIRWGVYK